MGTRARVNVYDGKTLLLSIYNHWDGHPSGLGKELADYFGEMTIGNGGSGPENYGTYANGMGCFAAQLLAFLKNGQVGNVYVRDHSIDSHGEEFVYNLRENRGKVEMEVRSGRMTMFGDPGDPETDMLPLFTGSASEFHEFLLKQEEDAE